MRLTILSILALSFYGFVGMMTCAGPAIPVTITTIVTQAQRVSQVLNAAKLVSEVVSGSVNESYADLGTYLKDNDLTTENIARMEQNLALMRAQADTLNWLLSGAENEGTTLFKLLEQRAEENQTKSLRKTMLADIEEKNDLFSSKIKTAHQVLKQINASIQKYDDILGYIQVETGVDNAQKIIDDVSIAIEDGKTLNSQIQEAIDEGLDIIDAIQSQPGNNEEKERGRD